MQLSTFSLGCSSIICVEEGWEYAVVHKLPLVEQSDDQESVSTFVDR